MVQLALPDSLHCELLLMMHDLWITWIVLSVAHATAKGSSHYHRPCSFVHER